MHPFFKTANNATGIPSNTKDSLWERLTKKDTQKKTAHAVWDIVADGNDIYGTRKDVQSVVIDQLNPGDLVELNLEDFSVEARVLSNHGDDSYSVVSAEGYFDNVHRSAMVVLAQADQSEVPTSKRPTREDIPRQSQPPGQQQAIPIDQAGSNQTAENILALLNKGGGFVALQIAPTNVLELTQTDNGLFARLLYTSTEVAHQGNYNDVNHVVQSLNLNGWYPEAPRSSGRSS